MPRLKIESDGTSARTFVTLDGVKVDEVMGVEWKIDTKTRIGNATIHLRKVDLDVEQDVDELPVE